MFKRDNGGQFQEGFIYLEVGRMRELGGDGEVQRVVIVRGYYVIVFEGVNEGRVILILWVMDGGFDRSYGLRENLGKKFFGFVFFDF